MRLLRAVQTTISNVGQRLAQYRAQITAAVVAGAITVVSGIQSVAAQTPVPITIDTNGLFTQVNTWTSSLDDVIFVGVAISIALAILTFIGSQIIKAFRGGGAK